MAVSAIMSSMSTRMMSSTPTSPSSTPPSLSSPSFSKSLPVRTVPGSYGWPLLGPISDRLNYFWFQGPESFFRTRIEKNKSTVFRTNVPPSFPFFLVNPNVVAVLDVKSFSHLFDMELVDKTNVLVGEFMPSVDFTGGLRVCAYLDTSEPKHTQVKNFAMDVLKRSSKTWVSTLVSNLDTMWDTVESDLSGGASSSSLQLQQFLFTFLTHCITGADPSTSPDIAANGSGMLTRWVALQILPTTPLNILQPLEEIFLHSFTYPFFLVQNDYNKLVDFVKTNATEAIQIAQQDFNLSSEEAIHNLLFILGFNAFGGFSIFLPSLLSALETEASPKLKTKLRNEVQTLCGTDPRNLSFEKAKSMELVQSFVYETLRLNPPVPLQYGRARRDFGLCSHESVYEIKKGELLCGFQKLVMRDEKVFDEAERFVAERFVGEKGKEMLNYLYWSNGPQNGTPMVSNKQCAGKDVVTLTATLFMAYLFQRYESVTLSNGSVTALEKNK